MTLSLDLPVSDDYVPSAGELNNMIYLCHRSIANWTMRGCDLSVCLMMAGEISGNIGLSHLCEVCCEYIWDHILGEPDEHSPEDFFKHMKMILNAWYKSTTLEERANIN